MNPSDRRRKILEIIHHQMHDPGAIYQRFKEAREKQEARERERPLDFLYDDNDEINFENLDLHHLRGKKKILEMRLRLIDALIKQKELMDLIESKSVEQEQQEQAKKSRKNKAK